MKKLEKIFDSPAKAFALNASIYFGGGLIYKAIEFIIENPFLNKIFENVNMNIAPYADGLRNLDKLFY